MPHLYLFAEGQTERAFADTVLKPHLTTFVVYLHRPALVAHAKKRGKRCTEVGAATMCR